MTSNKAYVSHTWMWYSLFLQSERGDRSSAGQVHCGERGAERQPEKRADEGGVTGAGTRTEGNIWHNIITIIIQIDSYLKMTNISFQNQEIEELTKICDELIAKLGTTDWEDILTVRFSHMPCLTQTHSGPAQHVSIAFFLSFFHESDSATGRKVNETYVYGFKSADVRTFSISP